jgi:hypothetical protein
MMARKRSAIVPRAVFGVSFGGVVPACVALGIQACSSGPVLGVAAVAYCCFEASAPDADAGDAPSDSQSDGADAPSDAVTDAIGDVQEGG